MPQSPKTMGPKDQQFFMQTTPTIKTESEAAKCSSASNTNNNNTIFNFPAVSPIDSNNKSKNLYHEKLSDGGSSAGGLLANGMQYNTSSIRCHEGNQMDVNVIINDHMNVVNVVANANTNCTNTNVVVARSSPPHLLISNNKTNNNIIHQIHPQSSLKYHLTSSNSNTSSLSSNQSLNVINVCASSISNNNININNNNSHNNHNNNQNHNNNNIQMTNNNISNNVINMITTNDNDGNVYLINRDNIHDNNNSIKVEPTTIIYETIYIENNPQNNEIMAASGLLTNANNNKLMANKNVTLLNDALSANGATGGIIVLTGSLNDLLLNASACNNNNNINNNNHHHQQHHTNNGHVINQTNTTNQKTILINNTKCLNDVKNNSQLQSILLNLNSQSSVPASAPPMIGGSGGVGVIGSGNGSNQKSIMLSINQNQQVNIY